MKRNYLCLAFVLASSLMTLSPSFAKQPLPRSTPEAQGISSQAIQDFVSEVDKINTLHSFILVRHGRVIAEDGGNPKRRTNRTSCIRSAKVSTQRRSGWPSPKVN